MIIEGTLGITASHFLLDLLRERELLPGFVDGYGRIAADEQRHIAYGTWFLREAVAEDPAMAEVVRRRLLDLLPAVAESVSPPSDGAWDVLGVEDGELAEFGLGALNRRLILIGAPLDVGVSTPDENKALIRAPDRGGRECPGPDGRSTSSPTASSPPPHGAGSAPFATAFPDFRMEVVELGGRGRQGRGSLPLLGHSSTGEWRGVEPTRPPLRERRRDLHLRGPRRAADVRVRPRGQPEADASVGD